MRASFRIGRIAGVPVGRELERPGDLRSDRVGAVRAASSPPPTRTAPAGSTSLAGLSAAVAFFVGLLAHEVSHAMVAKRNGLEVGGITLWLFGGVAELRGEARDPGAELRIAGVGPLVSLIIGLVFGGARRGRGRWPAPVTAAAGRRAGLAGRHQRAAGGLQRAAGRPAGRRPAAARRGLEVVPATGPEASVVAARAGWVLGVLLIVFGLWQFFTGVGFGGIWLALIGWFLIGAAGAGGAAGPRSGSALHGVRVGDVMTPQPQIGHRRRERRRLRRPLPVRLPAHGAAADRGRPAGRPGHPGPGARRPSRRTRRDTTLARGVLPRRRAGAGPTRRSR